MLTFTRLIRYINSTRLISRYFSFRQEEPEYTLNTLSYSAEKKFCERSLRLYVYFGAYKKIYTTFSNDDDGISNMHISLTYNILTTYGHIKRSISIRIKNGNTFYYYLDIIYIKDYPYSSDSFSGHFISSFNLPDIVHKILNHFFPVGFLYRRI